MRGGGGGPALLLLDLQDSAGFRRLRPAREENYRVELARQLEERTWNEGSWRKQGGDGENGVWNFARGGSTGRSVPDTLPLSRNNGPTDLVNG